MNEIKIFENTEFGSVRTIEENGKVMFCGKDIAMSLGYKRPADAISAHCKGVCELPTPTAGGVQKMKYISEGDIYRLAAKSELPGAEKFESWIFDEVLPSIRKHGAYMTENTLEQAIADPDFLIKLATELKNEKEKRKELETKVNEDKPKVLFADAVETAQTSILVGDLAKLIKQNGINIGQKRLFSYLRENGYLIKNGSSKNMPTQKSMEMNLFEVKERTINNPDGTVRITKTTKVTGKGQTYFINKFLGDKSA
ncbi:MAG: phage repressor protein/antirepressor Ant [Oscillospiraceae bacterium]|nr:phage repressor protein/antirepressor Ant [Oscillospiraceae bacterium]